MAREFNGSSEYLETDTAAAISYPFTVSCWVNVDNLTHAGTLWSVVDKDVVNEQFGLVFRGDQAGDFIRFRAVSSAAGNIRATTTTGRLPLSSST